MELLNSNLNFDDRLTQPNNTSSSCSWSELPLDLLNSVFERLSFADFQRGKSVCSSWYSASRQSVPTNHIPWLLLFPKDEDNDNVCKLFNPEEKDKPYKTRDLGLEFSKSVCVATCGSWLLMRDPRKNLYIVNLFTNDEIIKLPLFEAQLGPTKVEGSLETKFRFSNARKKEEYNANQISINSPVFWIDDKTKDYIVLWGLVRWCVVYARNGDNMWNQIPDTSCCFDMVYKDHKLYFSSFARKIFIIIDFSRGIPKQTFTCRLRIAPFDPSSRFVVLPYCRTKLVVTLSGDVLRVERLICRRSGNSTFLVYRVYSSRRFKKYERVDSLGDEAMLLNMGITVLANDIEGFKRNSIYFNNSNGKNITCIFNLETQKMEPQHETDCSSVWQVTRSSVWQVTSSSVWQVTRARWFLPSFNRKCF